MLVCIFDSSSGESPEQFKRLEALTLEHVNAWKLLCIGWGCLHNRFYDCYATIPLLNEKEIFLCLQIHKLWISHVTPLSVPYGLIQLNLINIMNLIPILFDMTLICGHVEGKEKGCQNVCLPNWLNDSAFPLRIWGGMDLGSWATLPLYIPMDTQDENLLPGWLVCFCLPLTYRLTCLPILNTAWVLWHSAHVDPFALSRNICWLTGWEEEGQIIEGVRRCIVK